MSCSVSHMFSARKNQMNTSGPPGSSCPATARFLGESFLLLWCDQCCPHLQACLLCPHNGDFLAVFTVVIQEWVPPGWHPLCCVSVTAATPHLVCFRTSSASIGAPCCGSCEALWLHSGVQSGMVPPAVLSWPELEAHGLCLTAWRGGGLSGRVVGEAEEAPEF